jgi:hypothetical protein
MLNTIPSRMPNALPFRPRWTPPGEKYWSDEMDVASPSTGKDDDDNSAADTAGRYDRVWREHVPHIGRRPPEKGTGNFRGVTTDGDRREIVLESTLEHAAAQIALADPRLATIKAQVGRIYYKDDLGKERHGTFDFVAKSHGGSTLGIAVKPERKRESSGIDDTVEAVREQHPDFAREIEVWTENNLPRSAEHNAGLILRSRKLRNEDDVAAMRQVVERTVGAVHIGHLLRVIGSDARAFNAAVNLIDDGVLVPVQAGRIQPDLKVRRAA